jgi:hypothetical protein
MSFFWGSSSEKEEIDYSIRKSYLAKEEEIPKIEFIQTNLEEKKSEWVLDNEKPYAFTDFQLLRFLRQSKSDEVKASHMLIKHANWFRENDVESITKDDVIDEVNKQFVVPKGRSKTGRPCIWVCVRRHDKNNRSDIDVMRKFIIWCVKDVMSKALENDERFVLVFDLRELRLLNVDYEVIKLLISILQINYPEVLDQALIIGMYLYLYSYLYSYLCLHLYS